MRYLPGVSIYLPSMGACEKTIQRTFCPKPALRGSAGEKKKLSVGVKSTAVGTRMRSFFIVRFFFC